MPFGDNFARVRCATCGREGLATAGARCLHCGAPLPLPDPTMAAPLTVAATAPGVAEPPDPAWQPASWPSQAAPGVPGAPVEPAFPLAPGVPETPVVPARRRRVPWSTILLALAVAWGALRAISALVLHPQVVISHSKVAALLDLATLGVSFVLLLAIVVVGLIALWSWGSGSDRD